PPPSALRPMVPLPPLRGGDKPYPRTYLSRRIAPAPFRPHPRVMEPTPAEAMTERHARILGRLAEIGMALVEDLASAALAAEAPAEKATLASACHKLSRSVRQSLALEARFTRDAERARHEAQHRAEVEA